MAQLIFNKPLNGVTPNDSAFWIDGDSICYKDGEETKRIQGVEGTGLEPSTNLLPGSAWLDKEHKVFYFVNGEGKAYEALIDELLEAKLIKWV